MVNIHNRAVGSFGDVEGLAAIPVGQSYRMAPNIRHVRQICRQFSEDLRTGLTRVDFPPHRRKVRREYSG